MKTHRSVAILFALALILRLIYVIFANNFSQDKSYVLWEDQGWTVAKNLLEGKGYTMYCTFGPVKSARPPVFPLFLFAVFRFFGESPLAILVIKLFLAIFGSLTCLVIYFLAKAIFNQKIGLLAMMISAILPSSIHWCSLIMPEIFSTLFLSLAVLFILKIEKDRRFYYFLSGLFLGLLIMTKSSAYGLLPMFLLWAFFAHKNRKRGLLAASYILIAAAIVISGWVIRNYKIHHAFLLTSTEGGTTFYFANNPDVLTKGKGDFYIPRDPLRNPSEGDLVREVKGLTEIKSNNYFYKKGLDFIKHNPMVYLRLAGERFLRFWRFYPHPEGQGSYGMVHIITMLFTDGPIILLGFWGLIRLFRIKRKEAILFLLIFLNFTVVSMLIRSCIRYRAPIMPYLIILASALIYSKYTELKQRWHKLS